MIALRGATTVEKDAPDEIKEAVLEMFDELMKRNQLKSEKIVSILFTATRDVHSAYPGKFLRMDRGITQPAILHFQEMEVDDSLQKCIRVLINYDENIAKVNVYLRGASALRPDLNT